MEMFSKKINKIILLSVLVFFVFGGNVFASDLTVSFFIESSFDVSGRTKIDAVLVESSSELYFYVEKNWWESQLEAKKNEILKNLETLSGEFKNNIYPNLTSVFGTERRPGIDGDEKITVLFHPVKGSEGGYFRTADGYDKLQIPISNQREMVYISADLLTSTNLKVALAHEFVHLITFNQKNVNFGVEEEVWLNEARAEYSATILGYNERYASSVLQSRVRDFIESPTNSITEWRGVKYDYASINLFTHYLVDHYGIRILSDSLKSKHIGIESINYALEKAGKKERFPEIFTDWTIATVLNDCSFGSKYCYLNKNLIDFRIYPNVNFLPITGNTSLSVISVTKNWSGNWQKFVGGNGEFVLNFSSSSGLNFVVPCILESKDGRFSIKFVDLKNGDKGSIKISNFGTEYSSLIMIPSLQNKFSGFNGSETGQSFNYNVKVGSDVSEDENPLIQELLEQIESLKKQIAELQKKLGFEVGQNPYCSSINSNLYFGISGSDQVKCLQGFLKSQGKEIYPEGLVTGFFGNLTKSAVIKFQEKYASEILNPLGLYSGTGYVGPSTRSKINQLL
jgi:hypothetical protein